MRTLTDKQISLLSWVAFGLALTALTLVISNAFLETQTEFLVTQRHLSEPIVRRLAPSTDTSTWKTYRNEQYGFEVRYPADKLQVTEVTTRLPHANQPRFSGVELFHSTPTGKTSQDTCYYAGSGIPYPCQSEIKDTSFYFLIVPEKYEIFVSRYKSDSAETIGGKRWVVSDIGFEGDGSLYYLTTRGDDKTFLISRAYKYEFDDKRHGDHDELLFKQILSTFKFIEPQVRQDILYPGNSTYQGWTEAQMKNHCSGLGGTLNPCGRACLDPEEVCIQVCVPRCEFKLDL